MRGTPAGKRKRGRPKETSRRSVDREMKNNKWTCGKVQKWTQDR